MSKKKKSLTLKLRNYFFTGVIVLVPIGFTLYLSKFLINFSTKLVPAGLNPNTYLPYSIIGIEIILTITFITIIGGLSLSFIGKKFLQLIDSYCQLLTIIDSKIDKYFLWGSNKISLVLLKKIGSPLINKEYNKKSLGVFLKNELINQS